MKTLIPHQEPVDPPNCSLCGEKMVFLGRADFGLPLFGCDTWQDGVNMPDDGFIVKNTRQNQFRELE